MRQSKKTNSSEHDKQRREDILKAALECFLKFGYSKTSLDDIAKEASISRPLLYLKFNNKEDIFRGTFEYVIADGYSEAEKIVRSSDDKKKRILAVYELLILGPWDKMIGKPMAQDFYKTCVEKFPELSDKHEKLILKYVSAILGSKDMAEVFTLSVSGLETDVPSTKTLRKRIEILAERFS